MKKTTLLSLLVLQQLLHAQLASAATGRPVAQMASVATSDAEPAAFSKIAAGAGMLAVAGLLRRARRTSSVPAAAEPAGRN
jgi:MYXO-CTERM domain-containing protein